MPNIDVTRERYPVWECEGCGAARVWGTTVETRGAREIDEVPNPAPTLQCAGACGTATTHTFLGNRGVTVERRHETLSSRELAKIERVEFRIEAEEPPEPETYNETRMNA